MESWWVDNEEDLNRRGMKFKGHACITTTKGRRMSDGTFLHEAEYKESENLIKRLVLGHHIPNNVIFSDVEEWRRSIRRGMQKHNMASGRSTRTNRGRLAGDKGWKAYGFDKAKRLKKSAVFAITELFSGCTSDSEPEGEDQTANTPPQNPLSPTDYPGNAMRHADSLSGVEAGTHSSLPDTLNNHTELQYNPRDQQLGDREREDIRDHRRASRVQIQASIQHSLTLNSPRANLSLPSPLIAIDPTISST
ncbi:hypothetical protein AX16_007896 [Volvariella volvacea WC 439]|nr:hypothetical protein AX16_007896 [Volvariella volvacea WC 439]